MGVWNINAATDLISCMAQSTFITDTNSVSNLAAGNVGDSSDYAKILAEKIAEVNAGKNDTQQNNSANQQENKTSSGESSDSMPAIETLRRIMPDGSIRIVTYQDGEIVDQLRIRPHLVTKPDYSLPPEPNGEAALKDEYRLSLAQLLMT